MIRKTFSIYKTMYSYCFKHVVLLIYMIIILRTGKSEIPLNLNNEDIRNSIDNIVNVIEMLREIKTDNIFALQNILGKSNLRTRAVKGNKELIDQLKLVLSLLGQRQRQKLSIGKDRFGIKEILRKNINSDDESNSNEVSKDKLNEKNKNGGLRDYYEENSCKRGKKRCYKACKEAYRETCDYYYCEKSLRRKLRKFCKYECRRWFY